MLDCFKSIGMNAFIVGNDLDREEAATGFAANMAGGVWPLFDALELSLLCLLELLLLFVLEEMREAGEDEESEDDEPPFMTMPALTAAAAAAATA